MKIGRLIVTRGYLKIEDEFFWCLCDHLKQDLRKPFFCGHSTIAQILFNVSNVEARKYNMHNVKMIIRGLR